MGGLDVARVEIVVAEDRAADRADEHRAVLHAEFVEGARQQFADDSVPAARAIVGLVLVLKFGLALEGAVEGRRAFADGRTAKLAMDADLPHVMRGGRGVREGALEPREHLFRRRNVAADAAEKLHARQPFKR